RVATRGPSPFALPARRTRPPQAPVSARVAGPDRSGRRIDVRPLLTPASSELTIDNRNDDVLSNVHHRDGSSGSRTDNGECPAPPPNPLPSSVSRGPVRRTRR